MAATHTEIDPVAALRIEVRVRLDAIAVSLMVQGGEGAVIHGRLEAVAVLGKQVGGLVRLEHQSELGRDLPFGKLVQLIPGVGWIIVRGHPVVVIAGARGQHPALAKLHLVEGPQGATFAGSGREAQLVVADKIIRLGRPLVAGAFIVGVLILGPPGQTMVGHRLVELQLGAEVLLIEHVVIQRVFGHIGVARVNRVFG